MLGIDDPLPEQQSTFHLASVGAGTRLRLLGHLNGSLDFAVPLDDGPTPTRTRRASPSGSGPISNLSP